MAGNIAIPGLTRLRQDLATPAQSAELRRSGSGRRHLTVASTFAMELVPMLCGGKPSFNNAPQEQKQEYKKSFHAGKYKKMIKKYVNSSKDVLERAVNVELHLDAGGACIAAFSSGIAAAVADASDVYNVAPAYVENFIKCLNAAVQTWMSKNSHSFSHENLLAPAVKSGFSEFMEKVSSASAAGTDKLAVPTVTDTKKGDPLVAKLKAELGLVPTDSLEHLQKKASRSVSSLVKDANKGKGSASHALSRIKRLLSQPSTRSEDCESAAKDYKHMQLVASAISWFLTSSPPRNQYLDANGLKCASANGLLTQLILFHTGKWMKERPEFGKNLAAYQSACTPPANQAAISSVRTGTVGEQALKDAALDWAVDEVMVGMFDRDPTALSLAESILALPNGKEATKDALVQSFKKTSGPVSDDLINQVADRAVSVFADLILPPQHLGGQNAATLASHLSAVREARGTAPRQPANQNYGGQGTWLAQGTGFGQRTGSGLGTGFGQRTGFGQGTGLGQGGHNVSTRSY